MYCENYVDVAEFGDFMLWLQGKPLLFHGKKSFVRASHCIGSWRRSSSIKKGWLWGGTHWSSSINRTDLSGETHWASSINWVDFEAWLIDRAPSIELTLRGTHWSSSINWVDFEGHSLIELHQKRLTLRALIDRAPSKPGLTLMSHSLTLKSPLIARAPSTRNKWCSVSYFSSSTSFSSASSSIVTKFSLTSSSSWVLTTFATQCGIYIPPRRRRTRWRVDSFWIL